jgi:DNA-binding response OmpR family regulator
VQILLVEDETKVGNALSAGLQAEGYEIGWAQTGEEGFVYRRAPGLRLNNWLVRKGIE